MADQSLRLQTMSRQPKQDDLKDAERRSVAANLREQKLCIFDSWLQVPQERSSVGPHGRLGESRTMFRSNGPGVNCGRAPP